MSFFFKADDFENDSSEPGFTTTIDAALSANAKRDEVREILEEELIKVRAEIEQLRGENAVLRTANETLQRDINETSLMLINAGKSLKPLLTDNTRLREAVKLAVDSLIVLRRTMDAKLDCGYIEMINVALACLDKTASAKDAL